MSKVLLKWKFVSRALAVSLLVIIIYAYNYHPSCGTTYVRSSELSHIFSYCNSLTDKNLQQEGTVPSEQYKLESVHAIIRHGDRNRLHSITNYKDITISCKLHENHGAVFTVPEMQNYMKFMKSHKTRNNDQTFGDWPLYPDKEKCEPGELTPTGAAQHVQNGLTMKKRYIDNLKLLSEGEEFKEILVRSTDYSRTYQSALALLYGLLGDTLDASKLELEQALNSGLCYEKQGSLPCDCPSVHRYMDTQSSTYHQLYSEVMSKRKTMRVVDHYADLFRIPSSKVPKLSHLYDFNMVHVCNKVPLPGIDEKDKCVEPWAVKDVYDIIDKNGKRQAATKEYQTIARLRSLPLLDEIKGRLLQQAKGDSSLKFVLYSGHDSTINSLAVALNFSNGHWPPYASRIVLELYSASKSDTTGSDYYVRVLYNGKMVTNSMGFCKNHIYTKGVGEESGLCPLHVLQSYVDEQILFDMSLDTYDAACKLTSQV